MNKMRTLLTTILVIFALCCSAQTMKVVNMELAPNDLTARTKQKLDKDNKPGALVKVQLPEAGATFENSFLLPDNIDYKEGEYMVYMAEGAKRLKIKLPKCLPIEVLFKDWGISSLDGKVTYVVKIKIERDVQPISSFTFGVGFNVMSILGPSVTLGFDYKHFNVEIGGVYGLNKSSDIYIYNKGGTLKDGYSYKPIRGFLRAGYDFKLSPIVSLTPQIGGAFSTFNGSRLDDVPAVNENVLDGASAISATVGLRLMFAPFGRTFRLQITPEYDFAVSKDKNYEKLSEFDSKIKSWAEGFNICLGTLFYF